MQQESKSGHESTTRKLNKKNSQGASGQHTWIICSCSNECRLEKFGPRLVGFSTYSELSDAGDSVEKYWLTLNKVPFRPACGTLSAINLILSGGAVDPEAHKNLNRNFIRNEYLKKVTQLQKEGGPQPDIEVIFTWAAIRPLLGIELNDTEDELNLHLIGDLTLLCNDDLGSKRIKTEGCSAANRIVCDSVPFSSLHFRQDLSSNLHFRQFNGSKTRMVDKVGMRNLEVLIELAASNWFQRRQRIGSSHIMCNLNQYFAAPAT